MEILPEIDTPAVLIDLDKLDANIKEMASIAKQAGVKLRPHIKTHKSVWIAHEQIKNGACGITVATLGEAEIMEEAGIKDILIAFPIQGQQKLLKLKQLIKTANISVALDSIVVAKDISLLGESLEKQIPVYLEVDTGYQRCGHPVGEGTERIVKELMRLKGIALTGLLTHAGHVYGPHNSEMIINIATDEGSLLVRQAEQIFKRYGLKIREISVGSTPTSRHVAFIPGVTEIRPGTYVFNDTSIMKLGYATPETCALSVLATVVGRPALDRVIIHGGTKTFTSDTIDHPDLHGFGFIKNRPNLIVERLTEEHGILRIKDLKEKIEIGDRLEIIPNHACGVVNLHDKMFGIRNGEIERIIAVSARGKNT